MSFEPPTFYWTQAGSYNVKYDYKLPDGTDGPPVVAKFTVYGPDMGDICLYLSTIGNSPSCTSPIINTSGVTINLNKNVFGLDGYVFTPGYNLQGNIMGQTSWVQVLTNVTYRADMKGQGKCYRAKDALDLAYPYPILWHDKISSADAPSFGLSQKSDQESIDFKAEMYLLWTASQGPNGPISGAIPVPLGKVTWGFIDTVIFKGGAWQQAARTKVDTPVFSNGQQYPSWSNVSTEYRHLGSC
jgi:hypothetical protein